jgi:autophagy-related protein 11
VRVAIVCFELALIILADPTTFTPPLRPSQLATAYLRSAHVHAERAVAFAQGIAHQVAALRLSFNALDRRVLQLADAWDALSQGAERELNRQRGLLTGLDADLDMVGRVRIHPEFMSQSVRKAVANGQKERTLGDYVSNVKMRQVADSCAGHHSGPFSSYLRFARR